jgi:predicted nucleic acid-binding protein
VSGRVFFDTNVLIYAFAPKSDNRKADIARELLLSTAHTGCISAQVIGEFYSVMQRKFSPAPSAAEMQSIVSQLVSFHVESIDLPLTQFAISLQQSAQLNYWDALIVEAARRCGASTLYTEDLQHGQRFGSTEVINPFL